jgi:hypothetical protein
VLENTNIEIASEMPPPPPPVRTFAKREEPAPPAREIKPKVVKTVKTYKSAEPVAPVEKPEDPKTATRSRIIDTVAKR